MSRASVIASFVIVSLWAVMHQEHAYSDEGMWLFNNPPRELLRKKYNFELTDAWLEHLQKASVRFNDGGSGSFISPHGLTLTNHHVGAESLQKPIVRSSRLSVCTETGTRNSSKTHWRRSTSRQRTTP